jgi:hypothetical protein
VDGGRQVESVLQDLAGAGVDHGPLNSSVSKGDDLCHFECNSRKEQSN